MVARFGHDKKRLEKLPVVTPVKFRAGTELRLGHTLNMRETIVTAAVLNKGTDRRDEQPENMLVIVVTAAVLNNGTERMLEQF